MLNWSSIWTVQRTRGLWGWLLFLTYARIDVDERCDTKVRAMMNMAGVWMSLRDMSQTNCASMMAQMFAIYTRRWYTVLMVVLVVMVVLTLLRFLLALPRSSLASQSYNSDSYSSASNLESRMR